MRENMLKINIKLTAWLNESNRHLTCVKQNGFIAALTARGVLSCIFLFMLTIGTFGNEGDKNSADMSLRGSGRVNPSTLGMELNISLGSYGGRGINVPINLNYSSKL